MSREASANADTISDEELTGLLADAEGTTPEEIELSAAEFDIATPEEATVVDVDETDDQEATDATQLEQSSRSMPEMTSQSSKNGEKRDQDCVLRYTLYRTDEMSCVSTSTPLSMSISPV